MQAKVILDPHRRRLANIFTVADLARLHAAAEIVWGKDEPMPAEEIDKVRDQVVAIIAGSWRYGDVTRFPKLRAILEVSGGFPSPASLDYAACFARGIRVLSCAPAFGPAVAEMGLGLALACARQIAWTDNAFRCGEPNWSHYAFATEIGDTFTLYGKPAGFIGYGGLARALKPLLEPFAAPIQVYDPWLTDAYLRSQGVTPVDLDTLLATSRFIYVLAVPSASNKALLSREKLRLIRPDAVLLLLSRAHVVDFDALTEFLAEGRFRAGIDVFPEEPLPKDHPIRRVKHAVLSSHRAGAIGEALQNIGRIVADDIEAICQGLVPQRMQVAQPEFIQLRG
ncbi:MAG TPA: NAD(P)-dependent oxidoreductase [Caldilineaceae bacterium]|nr:NAD(P)-dependent oxidoreductase [Caldilineaceae bacterium]